MSKKKTKSPTSPTVAPAPPTPYKGPVQSRHLASISPITPAQRSFCESYDAGTPCIVLHGVAGTGKTFVALYKVLQDALMVPNRRVILMRSSVPTRDIGFLPGNEEEKMASYQTPYVSTCARLVQHPNGFAKLRDQHTLEFWSTSFIRGMTFDNTVILVDECQNMTDMELNSIMTRLGENSRIVWCGDFHQTDTMKSGGGSGLTPFLRTLSRMPTSMVSHIEFGIDDIVRSPLVKAYLIARLQSTS